MRRLLHIHWRRPDGPVRGPFALSRAGALGRRTYRCRCGRAWERREYVRDAEDLAWGISRHNPGSEDR